MEIEIKTLEGFRDGRVRLQITLEDRAEAAEVAQVLTYAPAVDTLEGRAEAAEVARLVKDRDAWKLKAEGWDHDRRTEQRRADLLEKDIDRRAELLEKDIARRIQNADELKRQLAAAHEAREIETKRATQLNIDLITQTTRASRQFTRAEENKEWAERTEELLAAAREKVTKLEHDLKVQTERASLEFGRAELSLRRAKSAEGLLAQKAPDPFDSSEKISKIREMLDRDPIRRAADQAITKSAAILADAIEEIRNLINP